MHAYRPVGALWIGMTAGSRCRLNCGSGRYGNVEPMTKNDH